LTTKRYTDGVNQSGWPAYRGRVWQRNYYEHIVRDDASLQRIRHYIESNPEQWAADKENPTASNQPMSQATPPPEPLIPKHGGYRHLKSFQVAQLTYDVTARFCDRYIDKRSRTHDQMVQAARSGVQNIAEGSQASDTSKKMEMKLTNVARASLEELRLDYEDFLRQRGLPVWPRSDSRRQHLIDRRARSAEDVARWVQEVHDGSGLGGQSGRGGVGLSTPSTESTQTTTPTYPEIAANAALVLIAVATGLLDRQLAAQAKAFEEEGGFTERLYRTRQQRRKGQ
jgi:four helix bundle suffix protein